MVTFGSDEFFNKLNTKVRSEDPKDGDIYTELYEVIRRNVWSDLYNSLKNEKDTEDVFHEVYIAVYKSLASFLLNSENKLESQRQAWLNSITKRKIIDFWDKKNDTIEVEKEDGEKEKKYVPYVEDSLDNDNSNIKQPETESAEEMYVGQFACDKLVGRLEHLLNLDVGLDRLLGYCYSKIIIPLNISKSFTKNASGKPKIAASELNNKTIEDIVKRLPMDLQDAIEKTLPPMLFNKINNRLNDKKPRTDLYWRDVIYNLNATAIADASNRIQSAVDKESERLDNDDKKESDVKSMVKCKNKGGDDNE